MKKCLCLAAVLLVICASVGNAAPLFSNVQVSDVGVGNTISEPNTSRTVATSPSGTILVAYHGPNGIRVARSTNRGQSFSASVQITATDAPVEIAVSSTGTVYAAWTQAGRAMLSRSLDGGVSFSSPADVGPMASSQVHLATDGQYVYIVAQSGVDFLASGNSGVSFTPVTVGPGDVFSDVHVDPLSGDVYVQTDNPLIRYYLSTDHGLTFGPAVTPGGSIFYSTAAMSSGLAGRFLFVSGSATQAYRIDLVAGTSTSLTFGNNLTNQGRSLAADGCGNVVDSYTSGTSTLYAVSQDYGATFSPAVTVSASSFRQSVAINPSTLDVVAAYESGGQIYVSTYSGELRYCTSAPAVGVPTLNEWGMIIFAIAGGIGSVLYMRRRRAEA